MRPSEYRCSVVCLSRAKSGWTDRDTILNVDPCIRWCPGSRYSSEEKAAVKSSWSHSSVFIHVLLFPLQKHRRLFYKHNFSAENFLFAFHECVKAKDPFNKTINNVVCFSWALSNYFRHCGRWMLSKSNTQLITPRKISLPLAILRFVACLK